MEDKLVYMRTANVVFDKIEELSKRFEKEDDSYEKIQISAKIFALYWVLDSKSDDI